jgi:hypothetical protein
MSLLFRIVYAAHANGTHHKLALDALSLMSGEDAERWRNLFLKHAEIYLDGSKAPDNKFKDFKNHVLHVRDNFWGGAPEKAEIWYGNLLATLRAGAWEEAVYAAGVLSHYYTDPIQPFHTAQSEAENAIHRAAEWSISRSYDSLAELGRKRLGSIEVPVPPGAAWLKDMICQGAERSNRYYEKLIAHYDIHRGVSDPPSGLDDTARAFIGELIVYAAIGYARILERAFAECEVSPPEVTLTAETLLATLKIPSKWVEKRLTNAEDKALVRAMYQELQATGRVEATLPEDDKTVRDLYEREVAAPRAAEQALARAQRVNRTASFDGAGLSAAVRPVQAEVEPERHDQSYSADDERPPQEAATTAPAKPARSRSASGSRTSGALRTYLAASDDLEAAPSIGSRSAQWFAEVGIATVGDFLAADPQALAEKMSGRRGIDAETLRLWQQQARLVMDVPGLRGTHAQLLTGAGYLDAAAVAVAADEALVTAVTEFANTPAGKRILRQGDAPAAEIVKGWIRSAATRIAA